MNDEFLKALRRDPPPQFARRLKQQLQAQDAQSKRRSWSLRTRALLFLIVGSAFAGGIVVLERQSSKNSETAQSQSQIDAASPAASGYRAKSLGPGFVPEGNGTASRDFGNPQPSADSPANNFAAQSGQPKENAAGTASNASEQTTSGGLLQSKPVPSIATSPLTDALTRGIVGGHRRDKSDPPRIQPMAEDAAFSGFCAPGNARQFAVVVSSRRISYAEFMNCRSNGLNRIKESKLGYLALVLTSARDSAPMKLSAGDLYLAVAKQIPDPADLTRIINNTNFTWDQVNGNFEYRPIAVFGPIRETPLRALFETLLLEPGCNAQRAMAALRATAPDRHAELCHSVRDDRLYSEVETTSSLIPQYLWSDPHGFVLVDYQYYVANKSQLAGSALEGPEPSYATFADGSYPLARPIYLYADETRMERADDAYDDLHDLQDFGFRGPNRFGFVALDKQEADREPWRRKPSLSESDLIPPRSAPR